MNFEDPRFTAYALGELESAEDRAAVEDLLRAHPEIASEMEETRAVAELLRRELKAEDAEALTSTQRESVLAAALPEHVNGRSLPEDSLHVPSRWESTVPWWRGHWVPSAIAATVVLATGITALWKVQQPRFVEVPVTLGKEPENVAQTTLPGQTSPPPLSPTRERIALTDQVTANEESITASPVHQDAKADSLTALSRSKRTLDSQPSKHTDALPSLVRPQEIQEIQRRQPSTPQPSLREPKETPPSTSADEQTVRQAPKISIAETTEARDGVSAAAIPESAGMMPSAAPAEEPVPTQAPPAAPAGEVSTLLVEAKNFKQTGRLDLAFKRAEQVLSKDHYNVEARKLQEEVNLKRQQYAGAGYNHTRSYALSTVQNNWKNPVRLAADKNAIFWEDHSSSAGRVLSDQNHRGMLAQVELSNTESYDSVTDNGFLSVRDNPLSTFSIDVDTASYSNVRRFLTSNQRPPKGAVRIEELVNYFPYSYPEPDGEDPFSCTMEVAPAPWKPEHRLLRVGLKGRNIAKENLPPSNLIFLLDVSGSMQPENKLPLVKQSLEQLVGELQEKDTVGIVIYAGASGVILEPTNNKGAIRAAIAGLNAGGSTNGAAGIRTAYDLAQRAFKKGGNNRVILATDGDFNVGVTNQSELVELIEQEAKGGVFLSVLGFGMGNTKDSTMEKLADQGNGNYAYIDSLKEGRKVLVEQMAGTLFTIAKDVKIQVEFNPAQVDSYRLIGYENRLLAKEDFNDDKKDAGEIGAGHTVTALYEVVPAGRPSPVTTSVDPLKYRVAASAPERDTIEQKVETNPEMLTLKLRYKQPEGDTSTLREFPLKDNGTNLEQASADFRWSAAVAGFGMLLRDSPYRGNTSWDTVSDLASKAKGADPSGYRTEFLQLIESAKRLVPVAPPMTVTMVAAEGISGQATTQAAAIQLPEFEVTDLPATNAIDLLVKRSRELDPNKKGVSLVMAQGNKLESTRITLRMHNTTVLETAKAIASSLGLQVQEQGDILILRPE